MPKIMELRLGVRHNFFKKMATWLGLGVVDKDAPFSLAVVSELPYPGALTTTTSTN